MYEGVSSDHPPSLVGKEFEYFSGLDVLLT